MLYVNDLYDVETDCMSWSWYLANDFQFFILATLIIPFFHHWPKVGLTIVSLFIIVSGIISVWLTYQYHLKAFWITGVLKAMHGDMSEVSDVMNMIKYIYFKPWARVQPYMVGVVMGYVQLHYKPIFQTRRASWRKKAVHVFMFLVMLAVMGLCIFGIHKAQIGKPLSTTENAVYISVTRLAWGIALGYIVLLCMNGSGSYVNKFLSNSLFVPLSRLGYAAYLVHPIFLDTLYYSFQESFIYSDLTVAYFYIGHLVLAYGFGCLLSIFWETPLRKMEKFVFGK